MNATRIASLLPSATEIAYALGLGDLVVGVSHGCDYPCDARTKAVLTRPRFPLDGLSSGEIDAAVRQALREFGSVYEVDTERLAAVGPDLLLTQGVCEVCAVPTRDAETAAAGLACCPTVLALDAHDVTGVLGTIRLVGRASGVPERADECVREIERRIAFVRARLEDRPAPRVLALEWLEPPFVPGHWVPEMVALAGGNLLRGVAGRPSFAVEWADLAGLDPDVLLVMPCGFDLTAARADADRYRASLCAVAPRAIHSGRAYVVDATAHVSRPGPRVADGVELLAALLHPDIFPALSLEGRAHPVDD
ncbi:MAG TPA: cobalamin-binding protein [Gemmatimonadales bacterium]|nr:cobalamin-binding protein [Gemmatimonadales bacterium]